MKGLKQENLVQQHRLRSSRQREDFNPLRLQGDINCIKKF